MKIVKNWPVFQGRNSSKLIPLMTPEIGRGCEAHMPHPSKSNLSTSPLPPVMLYVFVHLGLADRFEEYPKLKELIKLKDELIQQTNSPPM